MSSVKRPRTPSRTNSETISSPDSQAPIHKASRTGAGPPLGLGSGGTIGGGKGNATARDGTHDHQPRDPTQNSDQLLDIPQHPLLCTLPPTCNRKPVPLSNSRELEAHYAKYHAHVCEERGCGCVFPDARLLELHQTECHDPLAAVRKERGDKIFACHLATCGRSFQTPKARRLHLIQAHAYPKEYFFAVTNKGIGGLLRKWGDGASLIRKEWKPRTEAKKEEGDDDDDDDKMEGNSDDDDDNASDTTEGANKMTGTARPEETRPTTGLPGHSGLDDLADSMNSLSLVPTHVRFGRGWEDSRVCP